MLNILKAFTSSVQTKMAQDHQIKTETQQACKYFQFPEIISQK